MNNAFENIQTYTYLTTGTYICMSAALAYTVTWMCRTVLPINPLHAAFFSAGSIIITKISTLAVDHLQHYNTYHQMYKLRIAIIVSIEIIGGGLLTLVAFKIGCILEWIIGYCISQSFSAGLAQQDS